MIAKVTKMDEYTQAKRKKMYICTIFTHNTMKKNLLVLISCFMAGVVYADPVGPSRALKIASMYMDASPSTICYTPSRRTRGQLAPADTLAPYYIVSRGDNAGFVIVSGDDCLPEVIGYTDNGDFVEEQMPPALLDMLAGYAELVEQAQAEAMPARAPRKVVAGRTSIDPIIKAHWHQSSPYNDLAPFISNTTNRALTGCTCTAAVMVLHHFRRDLPGELLSGTPTYGYGDAPVTVSYPKGTPILWDLMQYNYNGSYPEEMRNAVAVLNAAFGAGIWQTYGSSTSGQISNIVNGYSQYFNLGSECLYKAGHSQSTWENMVYTNLSNGQPMVYAGVHPSNGGHAIILDGYNAANGLFHFNFGWGGQGDGYYTLDDETGVNGFAGQQGMVYNIAPRQPKISAKLHVEPQAYRRMETTIRVTATNHGTLDYSGFNLYWSSSNRVPSSTTSVSESNTTMRLGTDESGEFSVSFKPSSKRTYYIFLTDKNCNVLDKAELEVVDTRPELSLESFDVTASKVTEMCGDEHFRLLYNDELEATAEIANASDATPLQANIRMELLKYDETGKPTSDKSISVSGQQFHPGETTEVSAVIGNLEEGARYALYIQSELTGTGNDVIIDTEGVDTLIRFKVCSPTLDTVSVVDGTMTLQGEWDALRFESIAADPSVTVYDLTQVTGISCQPIAANPNALFYTKVPFEGYNIVFGGICERLRLQAGYDFACAEAFVARQAAFTPRWSIAEGWHPFSLPFTAEKPDGYICQQVVAIGSASISRQVLSDTLYAYTPYMVMTCDNRSIIATDVLVGDEATVRPDTVPSFHAVVSATCAGDSTLVYSYDAENSTQYFTRVEAGTPLEPFTAVIKSGSKRVRSHRSTSLQNESYTALALAIDAANGAYDALHPQIEPAWNTLLLDSLSYAYSMFTAMQEEPETVQACASRLTTLASIYRLKLTCVVYPVCYNLLVANPSFEAGTKKGWVTDDYAKLRLSTDLQSFGVGMDGKYLLYNEHEEGASDISQTVHGLSSGYYRLSVMANSGADDAATLFAGDATLPVKAHPWGKYYLSEYVLDSIWVETDSLAIGVHGGSSWYKVDDFNLYYLGRGDKITDGIECPETAQPPFAPREGIYDLFGRRIATKDEMQQGVIYIVDGRKTVYRKE